MDLPLLYINKKMADSKINCYPPFFYYNKSVSKKPLNLEANTA